MLCHEGKGKVGDGVVEEIGSGARVVSGHRGPWGILANALILSEAGAGRAWESTGVETKARRLPRSKICRGDLGLETLSPWIRPFPVTLKSEREMPFSEANQIKVFSASLGHKSVSLCTRSLLCARLPARPWDVEVTGVDSVEVIYAESSAVLREGLSLT